MTDLIHLGAIIALMTISFVAGAVCAKPKPTEVGFLDAWPDLLIKFPAGASKEYVLNCLDSLREAVEAESTQPCQFKDKGPEKQPEHPVGPFRD